MLEYNPLQKQIANLEFKIFTIIRSDLIIKIIVIDHKTGNTLKNLLSKSNFFNIYLLWAKDLA